MVILETVYIVSGVVRSGTSMMMRCLDLGGIPAVYSKERDEKLYNKYATDSYNPNPNGYYELDKKQLSDIGKPEKYDGKLIKIIARQLPRLPEYNYKIVFMLREPDEIQLSYQKMMKKNPKKMIENYHDNIEYWTNYMHMRSDIDFMPVHYSQVISMPCLTFEGLKTWGLPIEPKQAAKGVDPALYRSRIKNE